jgi:hypothetical protein
VGEIQMVGQSDSQYKSAVCNVQVAGPFTKASIIGWNTYALLIQHIFKGKQVEIFYLQ